MKKIFVFATVLAMSCSKEQVIKPEPAISFTGIATRQYDSAAIAEQLWCGDYLYSITASKPGELFLISIVVPEKLKPGQYECGWNLWGPVQKAGFATISITSVNTLRASFAGKEITGTINIK